MCAYIQTCTHRDAELKSESLLDGWSVVLFCVSEVLGIATEPCAQPCTLILMMELVF